jgi:hypothetical protein
MRLGVLALLVTLSGCPFDDSDGNGSNYVAIDDVPAAAKDAWCTYLARCQEFPDKATCLGANVFNVPLFFDANTIAAIKAGRVGYNGGNLKLCLDAMANNTCDRTDQNGRSNLLVCRDLVRGTVHAGASCSINEECISQQCNGASTDPVCTMGVCIGDTAPSLAPGALGMPCSELGGCEDGTYCDGSTDTCLELKDVGTECTVSSECGYGLGCAQARTGLQSCQVLPQLGEPCIDSQCRDEGQYCGPAGSCTRVGLAGASCISGNQQCSVYFPCDFGTGVCKAGPTLGMSCSSGVRCSTAGTYCDNITFTCTALKADGELCSSALQCQSDYCDLTQTTCQPPATCI